MNASFEILGRKIGVDHPPLIIAELGINHGGSLAAAKSIVESAKRAGAEIIKHQTHIIDDEMSHHARSVVPGNTDVSIYDVMHSCALTKNEERELKTYVENLGMIFISTPFSRAAANFLEELKVPAYKIGSGECNNYPLIEHIARFGKPVILSTGMNDIASIEKAVLIFEKYDTPYALLHCTNVYPTPHRLVRLAAMQELQEAFPRAVIGLSDHTLDNYACLGAVALGASILERHYTDTRQRQGPDIVCSMDEADLKNLINGAAALFAARGGRKGMLEEEIVTSEFAFASVVSTTDIKKGDVLSDANLWVKRPGTGEFSAEDYPDLIGRVAACDIPADAQVKRGDIRW